MDAISKMVIIYSFDENNILKFIFNHSVRRTDDSDLHRAELSGTDTREVEKINNLELRYESSSDEQLCLVFQGITTNTVSFLGMALKTPQSVIYRLMV